MLISWICFAAALIAPAHSLLYSAIRWKNSNLCLTGPADPLSSYDIYLSECNGSDSQMWGGADGEGEDRSRLTLWGPLAPKGGRFCLITHFQNGARPEIVGCSRYNLRAAFWWPKVNNNLLEVAVTGAAFGPMSHLGWCLDVKDGNPAQGIQMWQCARGNPNQQFEYFGPTRNDKAPQPTPSPSSPPQC